MDGKTHGLFDRRRLLFRPLRERENKVQIERDHVAADGPPRPETADLAGALDEVALRVASARRNNRAVVLAFGAHTIKNGLGPVLIRMIERGWVTHLATNGAGIIHDWEFAHQGASSEDVRANVARGQFGLWHETGQFLNLALAIGASEGLGYGESVGALIAHEGLTIPAAGDLEEKIRRQLATDAALCAAAADLLSLVRAHGLAAGRLEIQHPWRRFSVQAAAFRHGVPFTGHPMFGHDIIYTHPLNCGAAIGRAAERDFLRFVASIERLEGGVYLSVGSAVMSPMIFEKAFSMVQNVRCRAGAPMRDHYLAVVDLARSSWDWSGGEPPPTDPAYYLRYCKTFSRMGGTLRYVCADNRDFLCGLLRRLAIGIGVDPDLDPDRTAPDRIRDSLGHGEGPRPRGPRPS